MARRRPRHKPAATGEPYIYTAAGDGFRVRIRVQGHKQDFGTYDRMSDAIAVRDAALRQLADDA